MLLVATGLAGGEAAAQQPAPGTADAGLRGVLSGFEQALRARDYQTAATALTTATIDYFEFVRDAAYYSQRGVLHHAALGAATDVLRLRGCLLGQYRFNITRAQLIEELFLCGLLEARMRVDLITRFRINGNAAQLFINQAGVEQPVPMNLFRLQRDRGAWRIDMSRMHHTKAIEVRKAAQRADLPLQPASGLYDYAHDLIVRDWRRRGRTGLVELWTPIARR